jgi:predicted small secreted protein
VCKNVHDGGITVKHILALVLLGITLAGCNTMSGMGRDIERGGEKMQNQARETQQDMRR